jgi:hypothetical protein
MLLARLAQSALPTAPSVPAVFSAPAVPSTPSLPAAHALGSPFGGLPIHSGSSRLILGGEGRELPDLLAMLMRRPVQSLANIMAEEAARKPASLPSAVPFCVSLSLSAPLQMPVSSSLSGPSALMRLSAISVSVHSNDSLFLAEDDDEGGVSMDITQGPSPHSCARGRVSLVRPAAASVDSSCGTRGALPVASRAMSNVVDLTKRSPCSIPYVVSVLLLLRTL